MPRDTQPDISPECWPVITRIRPTADARIFGAILHCDGGSRDLRNHLLAQRTPDTFWEIDWLYRGIEA